MSYPNFVEAVKKVDPKLYELVKQNMDLALQPGELDLKTKALIVMALDAMASSHEGVEALAGTARLNGATEEEIKETLRIAYMVSANKTLIASLSAYKKK
jgi:alkylhydroperoxidase/carboxymuconolactone decarboxylase family protein YurZ